jgi:multiple sugar transport system substrate-binding protein
MRGATGWAIAGVLLLAGCGGEDPRAEPKPRPERPRAQGTVTYCAEDYTGAERASVRRFNSAHKGNGLRARFRGLPKDPIATYDMIRKELGRGCDVAEIDTAYIAEFAARGSLAELSDHVEPRADEFIGATLETGRWDDRYWAVPRRVDVGLLYYRTDVGAPPKTWQQVYAIARRKRGILYQGDDYETLTIHFLELAYAAGGGVLSDDGTKSVLDSPENLRALEFMRAGLVRGAAPAAVLRLHEEEARAAFGSGHATFMRNWPYAYALLDSAHYSKIVGRFAAAPLPAFGNREPSGVVIGQSIVVANATEHPDAAIALLDHLTGAQDIERALQLFTTPPALEASFESPDIGGVLPHYAQLRKALEVAQPRPVTPAWGSISAAIFKHVHLALEGRAAPRAALKAADRDITRILAATPKPS